MSDYNLFWYQHFHRPRLYTSFQFGGEYEVMRDDGTVEWRLYPSVIDTVRQMQECLRELQKAGSPLLKALRKNQRV